MRIGADGVQGSSGVTGSDGSMKIGDEDFSQHISDASEGGKSDMIYYLQLQQKMQAESRYYETISNILKNRHDTAMNAVRNIH